MSNLVASKPVNLSQLASEMGGTVALRFSDLTQELSSDTATQPQLQAAYDAHVANPNYVPPKPTEQLNAEAVATAYTSDMAGLQAILDQPDIPAGTLTTAQLSNFMRTAQTNQRTIARALRHAFRYARADYSGST